MRRDVGDIWTTTILVETIHSILEVSWILDISIFRGWLMGPEATWLFTTMFVELERALPLDEGAETDLAEYLV